MIKRSAYWGNSWGASGRVLDEVQETSRVTRHNALLADADELPAPFTPRQVAAAVASLGPEGEGASSLQLGPVSDLRALCSDGLDTLIDAMNRIFVIATAPASCLTVVIACTPNPLSGERAIALISGYLRLWFNAVGLERHQSALLEHCHQRQRCPPRRPS